MEDGGLSVSNANNFYRGDLVEAIVTVDICVEGKEDFIPRTSVFLSFNRATLVACAHRLEEVGFSIFFLLRATHRSLDVWASRRGLRTST